MGDGLDDLSTKEFMEVLEGLSADTTGMSTYIPGRPMRKTYSTTKHDSVVYPDESFDPLEDSYKLVDPTTEDVYEAFKKAIKEHGETVTVHNSFTVSAESEAISCTDIKKLAPDHVLKQLSIMRSNLSRLCKNLIVDHINCRMTSETMESILHACRRLKMYGKEKPMIACFDEYGNRIQDKPNIETLKGAEIEIVPSNEYGPYFLEFKAVGRMFLDDVPF